MKTNRGTPCFLLKFPGAHGARTETAKSGDGGAAARGGRGGRGEVSGSNVEGTLVSCTKLEDFHEDY